MFFSYLITEISIWGSLVKVIKKIFGIINKRTVQIGIWHSRVIHVVFKKMSFSCNSYGISLMAVTATVR